MRFACIAKHRHFWPVSGLCEVPEVSFHAGLTRWSSARQFQDAGRVTVVVTGFTVSDRTSY